jgi:hypothetical protein
MRRNSKRGSIPLTGTDMKNKQQNEGTCGYRAQAPGEILYHNKTI